MLYLLGSFVLLIGIATGFYQWRLSRHRGMSRDEFVQRFRDLDIPDVIPAAVYDYYKSSAISGRFGLSPDDRYADLFSAESEDIEDDARELTKKLGFIVAVGPCLETWGKPFNTLCDMVLWLDSVRKM